MDQAEVVVRAMDADDAPALSRCMWRVYGDTYKPVVYDPDRIRAMLTGGLLLSTVAVAADGEIVGHQGLLREQPNAPLAEVTMGVVHPAWRGGGLFRALKEAALERARSDGLRGLYGEAVTVHDHSQRANLGMGGRETGVLLDYIPARRRFIGFDPGRPAANGAVPQMEPAPERTGVRQTALLFHISLVPEQAAVALFVPPTHRRIVARICANAGLRRRLVTVRVGALRDAPAAGRATLRWAPDVGVATIGIGRCGLDSVDTVRRLLPLALARGVEVVHLDLPLGDPVTPMIAGRLEGLGFSFAGLMPDAEGGDRLRLQRRAVAGQPMDARPGTIRMATDFGRDLLDYALDEADAANGRAVTPKGCESGRFREGRGQRRGAAPLARVSRPAAVESSSASG